MEEVKNLRPSDHPMISRFMTTKLIVTKELDWQEITNLVKSMAR